MGKLRILSGREVCAILTNHGFKTIRQRGSHVAMQKKTHNSTITVIVPDHSEIKRGTLKSIIRQSQVPPSNFEV
ncbi:MAG: type II toxin-antitoxin system HicA family toxin [Ignavibacteriales bacterium]|nr:type II toxin-antitoxin system HicA family toxin [Ignavibacteriales bacterium]